MIASPRAVPRAAVEASGAAPGTRNAPAPRGTAAPAGTLPEPGLRAMTHAASPTGLCRAPAPAASAPPGDAPRATARPARGRAVPIACRVALAAGLAALAACKDEPPRAAPADPRLAQARLAVEAPLAQRLRGEPRTRGVQVFTQALPGHFAVCGRVAGQGDALVPYVALVVFEANAPRVAELALGSTGAEATRVFAELVDRCFEGGGPPTPRAGARPLPPLPTPLGAPEAPPTAALLPPLAPSSGSPLASPGASPFASPFASPWGEPAPGALRPPSLERGVPTGRGVTTTARTGANIRALPGGGGEVVRIAPRATTLDVYGEAPGGWFQVGQGGLVWGWVHISLLER